jgi:photosystem II stability/assembly factor-like uncharacterized protein
VVWADAGQSLLLMSTDRGDTWQQRPVPPALGHLAGSAFAGVREGWLVDSPACGGAGARIWHTTDAGATWQDLHASGIPALDCGSHLSFSDSAHGYLTGTGQNPGPVVYRTMDGGRTWAASQPLPSPPGARGALRPEAVRPFGSDLLVTADRFVFRSVDGGATWRYAATAPDGSAAVALVTATRWLRLVAPGQSMETLDAGATWHRFDSTYAPEAPVSVDFAFADSQLGYTEEHQGIRRTEDGGLHWSYVPLTLTTP